MADRADINGYSDVSLVGAYARSAMEWAVAAGIMGQGSNLNPTGFANRAEVAVMINRFVQKYNL